ncbi:hypothetical protein HJC23_009503 [Cyclotella cryptica]|uniref:Uncharacterized protein n=1 Tax=Cyclotella cryptica TaxID=29204 RepID=A0ABD3QAZ2_9STRA|eukprot:CCRYP_008828-RA/>CCRYP_008828-RA protein AED:0.04 eAED:0.04 QI:57/1/1/1/0/0/2/553/537
MSGNNPPPRSYASRPIPTGFQLRGALKESHGHPIYAVAWSPHSHVHNTESVANDDSEERHILSYFATCAGPYATVYEVVTVTDGSNGGTAKSQRWQPPSVRQVYRDVDDGESFYACAFGGRGIGSPVGYSPLGAVENEQGIPDESEEDADAFKTKIVFFGLEKDQNSINRHDGGTPTKSKRQRQNPTTANNKFYPFLFPFSPTQNGPPLLCLGGTRGIIKVIDTVRRSLFLTLSGHGDDITDLQFSPTNEWLLLSASNDESIRLWNIQRGTNVAVFTGHDGHRRQVLSVAWHFTGMKFASAGMDNVVKLWNVIDGHDTDSAGAVQAAIEESNSVMPNDYPENNSRSRGGANSSHHKKFKFTPVVQQTPYFSTNKVHTDYVDCIQFVGDLILSKSVHNKVVLWKPLLEKDDNSLIDVNDDDVLENSESSQIIPSSILFLREFSLSHCDNWFVRFHSPPPFHRILALGNNKGEVKIWEIGGEKGCHPDQKSYCNLTTSGIGGSSINGNGGSTVRMVKFSPSGSCLVAVCDDSTIWMWES